jgi:hypothetical protein
MLRVPAPAARAWESLRSADLRDSAIARLLLRLRGYGARTRRPEGKQPLVESLSVLGFVLVGERPGRELVFGLIGRFWTPSGGLVAVSPEEFLRFDEKGYAKAAWNLAVLPETESASVLTTETRVLCLGAAARRRFRLYWTLVEPFSGILRKAMLRSIAERAVEKAGPR